MGEELDKVLDGLTKSERKRVGHELLDITERMVELLKPKLAAVFLEMSHEVQVAAGRESRTLIALERDEHPGVWLEDTPGGASSIDDDIRDDARSTIGGGAAWLRDRRSTVDTAPGSGNGRPGRVGKDRLWLGKRPADGYDR
jgi:hypothetical protein